MLSSLVRIIHGNVFLWHFSSLFEKSRFYAEVESLVARGKKYIDAVVDFCSRRGIEVETMTPNRSEPTGYKVVRVGFKDGRPDGSYEKVSDGLLDLGPASSRGVGTSCCLSNNEDGSLMTLVGRFGEYRIQEQGTGHLIWKPRQEPCRARRGTARGRMA